MIVASLAIVTARLADAPTLASANDRSRWCTVWSLAERGTWQIDEIRQQPGWDTIDIVRKDDHFYSTKPPLLPYVVSYLYRGLKAVTGWDLLTQTDACVRLLLFFINVLPMGLALAVLGGIVQRHSEGRFQKRMVMVAACFGTMLTPYLTVLNNHTLAATFLVFALSPALRLLCGERGDWWRYAACGFCTGLAMTQEFPVAAFAAGLGWLLFRRSPLQAILAYLPALVIPLAALMALNHQVTGDWKPFYAEYGTALYNFLEEGTPSYWTQPLGIDRPRDSWPVYLFHCTLGHHGFLSLTPIFLLAIAGWFLPRAWRRCNLAALHWLVPAVSAAVLGFYLTRTQNYNYSGVSVALRWMLWLTPLWIISLIPALNFWGPLRSFRWGTIALLAVSVFSAWYPARGPWAQNWIYVEMERAGWIDYSDPTLRFQRRHQSWISTLPTGDLQPEYWITFTSVDVGSGQQQLRLQDAGPRGEQRLISVEHRSNGEVVEQVTYVVDVTKFTAGDAADKFLVSRANGEPVTAADVAMFRGLQRPAEYQPARAVRYQYLKTSLRTDSFECHPAYAHETHADADGVERLHIRDVWYTAEVPFGVLRWEDRVLDEKTRVVLARRLWQPHSVGQTFPRDRTDLRP